MCRWRNFGSICNGDAKVKGTWSRAYNTFAFSDTGRAVENKVTLGGGEVQTDRSYEF